MAQKSSSMTKMLRLLVAVMRFGPVHGLYLLAVLCYLVIRLKRGRQKTIAVSVKGLAHPVYLRTGTSDVKVFIQVLLFADYAFDLSFTPRHILDGGGNIGLTAVYFANRYPDAKIVTVEPSDGNFSVLQKNVAPYPNITAVHGGLWEKTTQLVIEPPTLGEWSYTVTEAPAGTAGLPAYQIGTLMERYAPEGFDFVKLDIEGSEKNVLAAPDADAWLSQALFFITELHDNMKPGCSASFLQALSRHSFTLEPHGESIACYRV